MKTLLNVTLTLIFTGSFAWAQADSDAVRIKPGKYTDGLKNGCSIDVEESGFSHQWLTVINNKQNIKGHIRSTLTRLQLPFSIDVYKNFSDTSVNIENIGSDVKLLFKAGGKLHRKHQLQTVFVVDKETKELKSYTDLVRLATKSVVPNSILDLKQTYIDFQCENLKWVSE